MKLNSLLSDNLMQQYNLGINDSYKVEKINAKELITKDRIDLIAKLKYVEFIEKGYDLTFMKELYLAHLEALSREPIAKVVEGNNYPFEQCMANFDSMIDRIKKNGIDETFSEILIGSNNIIIDGAHRVAIAVYFNLEVPIIRLNSPAIIYDTEYFKEQLLNEKYIDYLVAEYCKIKDDVYVACIFPKAKGNLKRKEMELLINESSKIVYKKKVKINYEGLRNLFIQIYSAEKIKWIGCIDNNFSGAYFKAEDCYDSNEILTVYVLESDSFNQVLELKENIRGIFKIGYHSIHITDTKFEAIQIGNLLLNQNSVDFLNFGKPHYFKHFYKDLVKLKEDHINSKFALDECILDMRSTLALYGIKDVQQIEHLSSLNKNAFCGQSQQSHYNYFKHFNTTEDNLILNPKYYFVFNDLKFFTLENIKEYKKSRNDIEDQIEVKLIDSFFENENNLKQNLISLVLRGRYIVKRLMVKSFEKFGMKKFD